MMDPPVRHALPHRQPNVDHDSISQNAAPHLKSGMRGDFNGHTSQLPTQHERPKSADTIIHTMRVHLAGALLYYFVLHMFEFMRVALSDAFPLRSARVHEVCGMGAASFALMAAQGRCLWIRESWLSDTLTPQGLMAFLDPSQLLLARAKDQVDALAVAEEALQDGAVPFVVIEINRPLNLREGRRLQLAAKAGKATGLCLIPEGMGSNAAETRWKATPIFDLQSDLSPGEDSTLMRWEIIKNKSGTLGAWNVKWDAQTRRVSVVSEVAQR